MSQHSASEFDGASLLARLRAAGVALEPAAFASGCIRTDLPPWFLDGGNMLVAPADASLPEILFHPGIPLPRNAIVWLGSNINVSTLLIWGEEATIVLRKDISAPSSNLNCGGRSLIYLGEGISSGVGATLNARNGGSILVEGDALWSTRVTIYTDDMHAIRDQRTGARINQYGGTVRVGQHVWLGAEALVLPGADIGSNCVIGARGVVTGVIPAGSIAVGSPAKVVRSGVTWTYEDLP